MDSDQASVPEPVTLCEHRCLLPEGHVEAGEGHQYGYVLPVAGAEGDAPDFEARIAASLEDLIPDASLRWKVATRVSDLLLGS